MKKAILLTAVMLMTITLCAQEKVFAQYIQNGDVTTSSVSKKHLDRVPQEQIDAIPGLGQLLDKMDKMTILKARSITNIAKKMFKNIPKQLASEGYKQQFATKQGKEEIVVLQSDKPEGGIVILVKGDPDTNVVFIQGDFTDANFSNE